MSIEVNNNKKVLEAISQLDEKLTKRFDSLEEDVKKLADGQTKIVEILDDIHDKQTKNPEPALKRGLA